MAAGPKRSMLSGSCFIASVRIVPQSDTRSQVSRSSFATQNCGRVVEVTVWIEGEKGLLGAGLGEAEGWRMIQCFFFAL